MLQTRATTPFSPLQGDVWPRRFAALFFFLRSMSPRKAMSPLGSALRVIEYGPRLLCKMDGRVVESVGTIVYSRLYEARQHQANSLTKRVARVL